MQLIKWNPWHDLSNLQCRWNATGGHGFGYGSMQNRSEQDRAWTPAVDVFDNETQITIKAELPGVGKDNIAISVKDRVLNLSGERGAEARPEAGKIYRQERVFGRFERYFILPTEVDAEMIRADYKDGVLTIEIPKPAKQQPRRITVH